METEEIRIPQAHQTDYDELEGGRLRHQAAVELPKKVSERVYLSV